MIKYIALLEILVVVHTTCFRKIKSRFKNI